MHDIHLIHKFKEVFVNLVSAKLRVEVLKELSIAKFELLGNLFLNRSMYQVMYQAITITMRKICSKLFWCLLCKLCKQC